MKKIIALSCVSVVLFGCAGITPSTNIHQPMTAKPEHQIRKQANNGAIYNANAISFFEDRKPQAVGDILTINIVEKTSASVKENNNLSRQNTMSAQIPAVTGIPGAQLGLYGVGVNTNSSNAFNGKGDAANNNQFTGTITVTVIDVYENGNLLVSGEKQISVGNNGTEYVRLSGVVNPRYIVNNQIESAKVADAKIEYKSSGQISESLTMPWLSRFFMNILPF